MKVFLAVNGKSYITDVAMFIKIFCTYVLRGLYIGKYPPSPGGWGISADVIWRKKYEKGKRKGGKM